MTITVSEAQIQAVMLFYEQKNGKPDGLSIGKEVSKLADVLGVMWFEKAVSMNVPIKSQVAALLTEAGVL